MLSSGIYNNGPAYLDLLVYRNKCAMVVKFVMVGKSGMQYAKVCLIFSKGFRKESGFHTNNTQMNRHVM